MDTNSKRQKLLSSIFEDATDLAKKYPRVAKAYEYGTAGFRADAAVLDSVVIRVGFLAALRSCATGAWVGVMITASHNVEPDNGVKIIDADAGMLVMEWESFATKLTNVPELEVGEYLKSLTEELNIDPSVKPRVVVGRDTRKSSDRLTDLLITAIRTFGGEVVDYGKVTTPQLHYMVRVNNTFKGEKRGTLDQYYDDLCRPFLALIQSLEEKRTVKSPRIVDCANGVGALALREFNARIKDVLPTEPINTGDGPLNEDSGADFVQKAKVLPISVDSAKAQGRSFLSLDGDADRIVYYYISKAGGFRLLDGDKIIAVAVAFLFDLLTAAKLSSTLTIGVVQTAYANGASTKFISDFIKAPVEFGNTGVKNLHPRAHEFDIGIYFEANGHGTVLFSEKALKAFEDGKSTGDAKSQQGCQRLSWVSALVNPCVGDALSDMLLVEAALAHHGWTLEDWDALYEDLPSKMLKVVVPDRSVVRTTDYERQCTAPAGLQAEINRLCSSHPSRRSFVRPSGTEDVVRVYAEAESTSAANDLGNAVAEVVERLCRVSAL